MSTATTNGLAARIEGGRRVYGQGDNEVRALDGITRDFPLGRFTAVMGPSGSGKSTLMQCMAGLDRLTEGETWIGDMQLTGMSESSVTRVRRDNVGFIFQAFNLVPTLNARENILLPLDIAGRKVDQEWFDKVVTDLRIADRLDHRPSELSGGQQQRVAAARAIASRPKIIFADEPTGQLDSRSSAEMLDVMRGAVDQFGQTIIMVTHDPGAARHADQVIFLNDGKVVDEMDDPTADAIFDRMKAMD